MENGINAWEKVQLARDKERPYAADYIEEICDEFMELHGDRLSGDDGALIGGIGRIDSYYVTILAQQKGRSVKQNMKRNFGMVSPEGYRKAVRLARMSEKFHRPILCLVDTPGAFCGIEAEENGQGEAIAQTIYQMSGLKVPILSVVIGEGGSGGALALAVADAVYMAENAVYSILSPEGFASILWKDSGRAAEAAELMKMTAPELYQMSVVDKLLPEREEGGVEGSQFKKEVLAFLETYGTIDAETLVSRRYERFRKL